MKLKSVVTWLGAAALLAGVLLLYADNRRKDAELQGLRAESQGAQAARAEAEQAKSAEAEAQSAEIARLHKDNEELLRLRNEVRQLRDDKGQLTKQAQAAQAEAQRAQAQAAQTALANQQQQQQQQLLQAENQRLLALGQQAQPGVRINLPAQPGDPVAQRNACINILRQLDGAKQQWALERRQTAAAIPTQQDIAPYLGRSGLWPTCPAGGIYTLNAVGASPTCSIPGHALPR